MFPELYILDFIIPMYPLCVATGFLVGTAVLYWDFCKLEIKDKCAFPIMCFAEAGVIIGGKFLFLIINIQKLQKYLYKFGFFGLLAKTGYVFYGGLFGGLFAIWIFSKIFKQFFPESLMYILSVSPLIHAFGRVGCFCSGCCYGIKYNGFLNVYMNNVRCFPVQLLEAVLLLFLFFILQQFLLKKRKYVIEFYFLGYGIIRFVCEFLRGDIARGFLGALSISSWISLLCVGTGCVIFAKNQRKNTEINKDEVANT